MSEGYRRGEGSTLGDAGYQKQRHHSADATRYIEHKAIGDTDSISPACFLQGQFCGKHSGVRLVKTGVCLYCSAAR